MNQIWKWVMHLNAKAFCSVATLLFFCTVGYCVFMYLTPPVPLPTGTDTLPAAPKPLDIGILGYVDGQMADSGLSIPFDPFRPTMDDIFRTPGAGDILLGRPPTGGGGGGGGGGRLGGPGSGGGARPPGGAGAGAGGPTAPTMITPRITFLGFLQRSDGSSVAAFADSSDKSKFFYADGKSVHGVEIISTDMQEATVKLPDGTVTKLTVGKFVELEPEVDPKAPPTPSPVAAVKAGAGGARPPGGGRGGARN